MKRHIIIILFISLILTVNIITYIKFTDSVNASNETIPSQTEGSATSAQTSAAETTEDSTIPVIIETEEMRIIYEYTFVPFPISPNEPDKHIRNITNFDHEHSSGNIRFPFGDYYTGLSGITTFRGNNFRNTAAYGNITITEEKMEIIWSVPIGYIGTWTGVGWSGQPLIIKWPDELKEIMNIKDAKKTKDDLKEVIYATLDGNIYFLDLDDGLYTREPIATGVPHKGTPSVDPRGYPLLYAGQGINLVDGERLPLGFRIYSLIDQSLLYFLDGNDPLKKRDWFAFDSSPVIDAANDIVFEPGESGILYKIKLNTDFDQNAGKISISPEISRYRYDPGRNDRPGIENSMAAYMNYGFFADNSGFIQCVNLETLEPVWVNDLLEDTDASLVAESENGHLYLYSGSQVDFQGSSGFSYLRKIDGLTGEFIWQKEYMCGSDETVNGGVMATPAIGNGDLENYIFYNIARINGTLRSLLVALDKHTGDEIWRYEHNNYAWSSPIFVHSENDRYYIVQCDSIGQIILFDARYGEVRDVIFLGVNIEGSPALYDDMLVVGTRGQKIFGVRIY